MCPHKNLPVLHSHLVGEAVWTLLPSPLARELGAASQASSDLSEFSKYLILLTAART